MRTAWMLGPIAASLLVLGAGPADAQTPTASDCEALRSKLAEHAKISEGVRRMVASLPLAPAAASAPAASAPTAASPATTAPPAGRADAIRARLKQLPDQRQQLEEQRLGALVKFDLNRASSIQSQIQGLDQEKVDLEKELAALPATPAAPATPAPAPAPATPAPRAATTAPAAPVDRVACKDMPAAYESALKIRRKELGAREDNANVVPLMSLRAQTPEQIAQELSAQFAPWPEAGAQVALLDQDGDAKVEGFVDVPAKDTFRLHRQRADGTFVIDVFALPGRPVEYADVTRRFDEATARYAGWGVMDALAARPVGAVRVVGESGDFGKASAHLLGGRFVEAGQMESAAARSREFENFRGERLRMLEIITPVQGGMAIRRVLVTPRPNNQELWEETAVVTKVPSYLRTELELSGSRELRTAAGAPVGTRSTLAPAKVGLDR